MSRISLAPLLREALASGPQTVRQLHESIGRSSPAVISRALQNMPDTYIGGWEPCEGPTRFAAKWAVAPRPKDAPHPLGAEGLA